MLLSMYSCERDLDPAKTNWLNLLLPVKGSVVLHIGEECLVDVLRSCGCSSVISPGAYGRGSSGREMTDFDTIEDESVDLCVLDCAYLGPRVSGKTPPRRIHQKVFRVLKKEGVMLIGFATGAGQLSKKLFIETVLRKTGYKRLHWYLCAPSFHEPTAIYPYSHHESQARKDLMPVSPSGMTPRNVIKYLAGKAMVKSLVRYSPLWGTVLIAYKNGTGSRDRCSVGELEHEQSSAGFDRMEAYTVWLAKQYTGKQVGLVHRSCKNGKNLVSVRKVCSYPFGRSSSIQRENLILNLISPHSRFFQEHHILVPTPLFLETDGVRSMSGESPLPGTPFSELKHDLWRLGCMEKTVEKLCTIQLFLQQRLTGHLKDCLPVLDARYLENSIGVAHPYLDDSRRLNQYPMSIQHGDYTDVNLLYDRASQNWGVIDWEWAASGYPPLFDIFYLTLSLGFTMTADSTGDMLEYSFRSFSDTFFCTNGFSRFIHGLIDRYCCELGISREMVFNYFLDFLLFLYNKYKLDYRMPEYEQNHKDMIVYALGNKDEFSFR